MQQENVRIGGAVVFWKLQPEFQRAALHDALENAGMQDYCPDERADSACLKEALADEYSFLVKENVVVKVESLKERGAFEVVAVERGANENYYRQICWAKTSKDGAEISLYNTNGHTEGIRDRFAARKAIITGSQVGTSLVKMLDDRQAVSLRPAGGIYWIPASLMGWWDRVAKAVESAGGDKTAIFCLSTVHNPEMVKAVTDALAEEVARAAREVNNGMMDGNESAEHYSKLFDSAMETTDRLKAYEVFLDSSLDELRKAAEEIATTAAMAKLTATAKEFGVVFN